MAIYVSHDSALRYWATKTSDEVIPEPASVATLERASACMRDVREARLPLSYSRACPLHVLVSDRASTHALQCVEAHVWGGPLVPGSFNELGGAAFVSSPEFTFLQIAGRKPTVEAVRMGTYLCSSFAVSEWGGGYAGARTPLATPEGVGSFLSRLPGGYGTDKARRALDLVVANAASPMEILLAVSYRLPPRFGGWGMPELQANAHIEVPQRLRAVLGSNWLVGDLCIPSVRGDIEFDSYTFHTGRYRLDHTQARRNVLEVMGVRTMSCTWGQINTFEKFAAFNWMIEERFGIRHRTFTARERAAQESLYDLLTDFGRPLFVVDPSARGDLSVVFGEFVD